MQKKKKIIRKEKSQFSKKQNELFIKEFIRKTTFQISARIFIK